MNIREIREKYPQYDNVSDKELAEKLHQKYYKDMDFAEFSRRIGYEGEPEVDLPPLSRELRAEARGNYWQGVPEAFGEGFGQGLLSGTETALNGATLGGYNWLNRRLGGNAEARKQALQNEADAAGAGDFNRWANFAAEMGGGLSGAPRATAALGNRLLGSRLWNLPAYTASGAADAGIMSSFNNDFSDSGAITEDALTGGLMGGAFGLGGNLVLNPLNRMFSANALTRGLKGGLNNIADNPEAVRVMRRGIGASDDVARDFMNEAPAAARGINTEAADMINNSLSRRIDVPKTIASQKRKYRDFMDNNAGNEVMDFSPKPQLEAMPAESGFNPNSGLSRQDAESLLRKRAEQSGVGIYNDELSNLPNAETQGLGINHFFRGNRTPYVRTLHNTLDKADLRYSQNGKNYAIKKYTDNSTGKDFYDFVVLDNGDLFNKFPTNSNYIANQFSAPMQDVSLHRRLPSDLGGEIRSPRLSDATAEFSAPTQNLSLHGTYPENDVVRTGLPHLLDIAADSVNINPNGLVVNPNLPHYSALYDGLTPFQTQVLDNAIERGAAKTTNKLGTLDSINRIKQELNADIIGSQQANPANRLSSVDTPDTVAMRAVKQRVDKALGDALKGRDRNYRKAKSMEEAYNAGRRYNPNAADSDELIPNLGILDKNAFAQGLYRRMTNNPLTGVNLANSALKYENALAGILPPSRYGNLVDGLNRLSTRYNRVANLGRQAENRLLTPEKDRLFAREQLESKGSILGTGIDWLNQRLSGRAYEQAAKNLLDPNFVGVADSWLMENYPTLSAYLSGMFATENY